MQHFLPRTALCLGEGGLQCGGILHCRHASPLSAFLWRIIAGIYGVVNPKFTAAHVPSFLNGVLVKQRLIDFQQVIEFAARMLPDGHHWILAVDELVKLSVEHAMGRILSVCSQWVKLSIGSPFRRCAVMTSFVPGFLSLSGRLPICIAPSFLRAESCVAMAIELGHDPTKPLVMGAIPWLRAIPAHCIRA